MRELNKEAPTPFTSDGKRAMVLTMLSVSVREVSDTLKKSLKVPRFQQRDLRRTVETMLQKLGVEREVRAYLERIIEGKPQSKVAAIRAA